jgi:hypothetical protein
MVTAQELRDPNNSTAESLSRGENLEQFSGHHE